MSLGLPVTSNSEGTSVGPNNFYLEPGPSSPQEIIGSLDKGLVLIKTIGHGLNPITGDISRGAFGLWVENGEIAYPVSEITIAGNLKQMLMNLEQVGANLEFRSSIASPTLLIGEMTISGQ